MSVSITEFGRSSDGTVIHRATLKNERITAEILSYAGVVHRLVVPDRKGRPVDVALGYPTVPDYEVNSGDAMGAIVGRYANRIGGAQFPLYEDIVHVTANQSGNCLHSGLHGLHHTVFAMEVTPGTDDSVTLTARSPDGMDGFPGNVDFEIQYRLAGCGLVIQYGAATDAPTVCNLTNHSYFNLNGHASGTALGHRLSVDAKSFLETDAASVPTGKLLPVEGSHGLQRGKDAGTRYWRRLRAAENRQWLRPLLCHPGQRPAPRGMAHRAGDRHPHGGAHHPARPAGIHRQLSAAGDPLQGGRPLRPP